MTGTLLIFHNNKRVFVPIEGFTARLSALPAYMMLVEKVVCCVQESADKQTDLPAYNFFQVIAIGTAKISEKYQSETLKNKSETPKYESETLLEDNETPEDESETPENESETPFADTFEVIAYFDEVKQSLMYIDMSMLQQNFRVINYAFHKMLNNDFQDCALNLPLYLESVVFHEPTHLALRNTAWLNTKNQWELMNGKMQHKQLLDFTDNI